MILLEELAPLGGLGISLGMHSDIVAPYLVEFATEEVKRHYLPRMATGELIGALAMSEPVAGSDLKAIRTTAVRSGDGYVLNGSKIFISNGTECGLAIVIAKTDVQAQAKGISLFVVDASMRGFQKGRRLKKIGLKAQDTAELFFNDVHVPATHLLGAENKGFQYLMRELPWERLQIAIAAVASAAAALAQTIEYSRGRQAFGRSVLDFQNSRFKLAELTSEVQIAQVFVDRCMQLELDAQLDPVTAAMAKYWCTDLQCKVVDECLQLHGGYGYMQEYAISRAYVDARAQRIYGGTNEIMKDIISRTL
jgi:acyl-CoA dehydrogenase